MFCENVLLHVSLVDFYTCIKNILYSIHEHRSYAINSGTVLLSYRSINLFLSVHVRVVAVVAVVVAVVGIVAVTVAVVARVGVL